MANQNFYKNYINKTIEKKVKRYFPNARVQIVSHHLCHAYSSVFSCDYNEGSFVTLDNAGSVLFDTSGQIYLLVRIIPLDTLIKRKVYSNIILVYLRQIILETTIGCGHIISM